MGEKILIALVFLSAPAFSDSLLSNIVVEIDSDETLVLERVDEASIKIDGHLDENVWVDLTAYDEFVVIDPDTLTKGLHATRCEFSTMRQVFISVSTWSSLLKQSFPGCLAGTNGT